MLVPEDNWDELADYLKTTSEQLDDYYEQLGKNKEKLEQCKLADTVAEVGVCINSEFSDLIRYSIRMLFKNSNFKTFPLITV